MPFLINGVPGDCVAAQDRGFHYGDGLFETLAVENASPLLWDRHVQRLLRGASRLAIQPPEEALLRREADEVCRGAERGVLKIILTRGISGRGYAPVPGALPTRAVGLMPWPDYPAHHRTRGIEAQFCHTLVSRQPALAGLKHLNRLEQVLGRGELAQGCAEGLMLDETGHVIEGTMTNLFIVATGNLVTPDLVFSGVDGVMRALVLEQAAALGMECRVTGVTRDAVLAADEIFVTNSLIGLWPVRRLGTREFSVGPVTQRIQNSLRGAHVDY